MIVGINQPYYLPYVGLFDRIKLCDKFVINGYSKLNRVKPKHRRVQIIQLHPTAKLNYLYLTQAISCKYDRIPFTEIPLSKEFWETQNRHREILYRTYKKAPHFDFIIDILDLLTEQTPTTLSDFNFRLIHCISKKLDLQTKLINISESDFDSNLLDVKSYGEFGNSANYQNYIICKYFGGNCMITGPNGANWVNEEIYNKNGIEIFYQKLNLLPYRQYSPKSIFVKGLSIVDLLSNCGEQAKVFIGSNSSVEKIAKITV